MEHTHFLGKSDLKVPRMGLGAMTWGQPKGMARWTPAQLAYGPSHGAREEEEALDVSLAAGVNLVDTAAIYSNGVSEQRLGELAQGRDIIIATKFPGSFTGSHRDFEPTLAKSLGRLMQDTIDLYQIHFTSRRLLIPELMNCMADAVESGKIRAVGVSNYSAAEMRQAHAELAKRGIPLASNQVQYSLLYRKPEVDGVLDACRELGVTLIAYSPLASGALTGKYSPQKKASGLRRYMTPFFRGENIQAVQPVVELLRDIGAKYSRTPSQVALRWLIENEQVLPIPGAKNARQAEENAGALSFSLTSDEIDALERATQAWRK